MSKNHYYSEIGELVKQEKAGVLKEYGTLRSHHEAYAVLLEEAQEVDEASGMAIEYIASLWDHIRTKRNANTMLDDILSIQDNLMEVASGAIQAIAICNLYRDMLAPMTTSREDEDAEFESSVPPTRTSDEDIDWDEYDDDYVSNPMGIL